MNENQDHVTKALWEKSKQKFLKSETVKQLKFGGKSIITQIITMQVGEITVQPVHSKDYTNNPSHSQLQVLIHPQGSVFPIIERKVIHHFKDQ